MNDIQLSSKHIIDENITFFPQLFPPLLFFCKKVIIIGKLFLKKEYCAHTYMMKPTNFKVKQFVTYEKRLRSSL